MSEDKKPRGRPRIELNEEQLLALGRMLGMGMPKDRCAYILGISKHTLHRMINRDDEVSKTVKSAESRVFTKVLNTAYDMATDGKNPSMTMFWLKCRAGWRDVNPYDDDKQVKDVKVNYKVDDDE